MKILLIHPPVREEALPANLPLGLAYTAAALREAGVPCEVLDLNVTRYGHPDIENTVRSKFGTGGFTHVGISAIVTQFSRVEEIVGWVRDVRADAPVIVGGPISVLGGRLHEWLGVDVWQGESEPLFAETLQNGDLDRPDRSPIWMQLKAGPLNSELLPLWSAFNMEAYTRNPVGAVNRNKWSGGIPGGDPVPRSMNLVWARGCPYACAFCSHCQMGLKYRKRTPADIIHEMEILWQRYGVRYFHAADDLSTADADWMRELCAGIMGHTYLADCTWGCAARANHCSPDLLLAMQEAGCVLVGLGIESGSQKVLDSYNKRTTVEQNEKAINTCKEVFGGADYSMMVGSPVEDDESIQESIELCRRTKTRPEVVFFTTPLPGTPLYDTAVETGRIGDELAYVRSLGDFRERPYANLTNQSGYWLQEARARIVRETAKWGSLI